jgi:hypothetical protein
MAGKASRFDAAALVRQFLERPTTEAELGRSLCFLRNFQPEKVFTADARKTLDRYS